jgi:hypothetical protein
MHMHVCTRCTRSDDSGLIRHKQSDHFIEKSQTCLQAIEAMTFVCDGCEEKAGHEACDGSAGRDGIEATCRRAEVPPFSEQARIVLRVSAY